MPGNWIHLCIDMQSMFAEDTPWHVPWMSGISPAVIEVSARHPDRTMFTRFVPPASAEEATGIWKDYYQKWEAMTLGLGGLWTSFRNLRGSSRPPAPSTR